MARVAVLQHLAFEGRGVGEEALSEMGHRAVPVPLYLGAKLPGPDDFDAWVMLGGLMSVNDVDQHAYLGAGSPECALPPDSGPLGGDARVAVFRL